MVKPKIDISKPLKEQFEKEGIAYPILKSNKLLIEKQKINVCLHIWDI
jgi:hypothetical protein